MPFFLPFHIVIPRAIERFAFFCETFNSMRTIMQLHRITVEVQENIAHHISFNSLLMNLGQQYKKSFKFKVHSTFPFSNIEPLWKILSDL